MSRSARLLLCAAVALSVAATACGGGGDDASKTTTPAAAATAPRSLAPSPSATPASEGTPDTVTGAGASTPTTRAAGGADPPPPAPAATAAPGRTYAQADAQALTQAASVGLGDVPADWSVMTDTTSDNTSAAAADPRAGESFARCGRLLGRLVTLQPPADQLVSRYLGAQSVSFFTNLTVYATEAGAIDCAIEAAVRFNEPGELARQFAAIFIDPAAVVVTPVQYPQVADGSFATTLSGKIRASGVEVNLTVLIVAFRKGNATAVVGSAAASAPSTAELTPLVDRVIQSIAAAQ
jgi:hypothetical protein